MKIFRFGSKTIAWTLGISLALNAFLLAAIARQTLQQRAHPHWVSFEGIRDRYTAPLRAEDAGTVRAVFEAHREEIRVAVDRYRQTREQVKAILQGDPLDSSRLNQGFSEGREALLVLQRDVHQVLLIVAERLPPEARRNLMNRPER